MRPVLNESDLADLLRVDLEVVAQLVAETALPRLTIAGQQRFLTEEVLAWLRTRTGPLLAPEPPGELREPDGVRDVPPPPPAGEDDACFVPPEALASLARGAADAAANMDRARLRDRLIAVADALSPALTRLSGSALHPFTNERHRTSPWRADEAGHPIRTLTLPWAAGEATVPGFVDRPRIALELGSSFVALSLRVPQGSGAPPPREATRRLVARGAQCGDGEGGEWRATFQYRFDGRPPTEATLTARLTADLEQLVPLWRQAVGA